MGVSLVEYTQAESFRGPLKAWTGLNVADPEATIVDIRDPRVIQGKTHVDFRVCSRNALGGWTLQDLTATLEDGVVMRVRARE